MGHLSNPIGFRLNFEKKWNFTFFVKNLYYPEAINTVINIRDYLYYYFTRKKILQSGLCLSHFLLYKYFKKLHVKVYLYHIDLQKTSYDLINKLFAVYYDSYNSINYKYAKNRTAQQLNIYYNYRDLSNPDLYVFLYTFKLFYEGNVINVKNKYFENNIYLNNNKIIKYNKFIIYYYLKQWMQFYKLHTLRIREKKNKLKRLKKNPYKNLIKTYKNLKNEKVDFIKTWLRRTTYKNINLVKIKGLVLYKAKKWLKSKPYFNTIIQKSNSLKELMLKPKKWGVIELAWQITKCNLKKRRELIKRKFELKQWLKIEIELIREKKKINYIFFNFKRLCFFNTYKILNFIVFGFKEYNKNIKIKNLNKLLHKIFYDKAFHKIYKFLEKANNKFGIWLHTNTLDTYKLDLYTLFMYLSKKIGFQKVRNSHYLWDKFSVIMRYIVLFNKLNLLKKNNVNNILNFLFYMKTAMLYSWYGLTGFKEYLGYYTSPFNEYNKAFPFNFKKHIFNCMYHGIYSIFFKQGFIWMTYFLKLVIFIINNVTDVNGINIINFQYVFLSNFNVTAQFLARYIVLKLKRGFTIVKTLNPLKKELCRVSWRSRKNQLPYLYQNMYIQKVKTIKMYKKILNYYFGSCNTYFYLLFNKYYNNNNVLLFPNIYLFYKKTDINLKKIKLTYLLNLYNIFKGILKWMVLPLKLHYKFKIIDYDNNNRNKSKKKDNKLQKYFKYEYLKKGHLFYPLVSNLEKKNIFYPFVNPMKDKESFEFLNNCFFSVINLFFKIEIGLKKKKINNLQISFNSFLNKYYINYTMVKTLWLIYNKLNLRNERDLYIPKYRSSIMGYKLVFKGRFSRKQRASKATLLIGKVPLNTLNFKVDYVFMTVPLKNSAISLKFYLYKNENLSLYFKNLII